MTIVRVGDKSVNLDVAMTFHWTWDEAGHDTGQPVKAVHIVYGLDGGKAIGIDVTDPALAMWIWKLCCDHHIRTT